MSTTDTRCTDFEAWAIRENYAFYSESERRVLFYGVSGTRNAIQKAWEAGMAQAATEAAKGKGRYCAHCQREADNECKNCKGYGVVTHISGMTPDNYEECNEVCPDCEGEGAVAAKATGIAGPANDKPVLWHVTYGDHDAELCDTEREAKAEARDLEENGWLNVRIRPLYYGQACAKATGTAGELMSKAEIDVIVYKCRQNGNDTTYDIVNACLAARQPAPALPVNELAKKLNALDMAIAHSTNLTPHSKPRRLLAAIIHEVCSDAALAATAAPVLSDDLQMKLKACIETCRVLEILSRQEADALLAATNRSQP